MKTMAQSGAHPDAESLSAFAEQALPAVERQQVLAHLAGCDRCREVVFLAQAAAGAEGATPVPAASPEPSRWWRGLFAGWRWTWIPATALAGVVGVAVLHHFKNETPVAELARNTRQEAVATEASAKPEAPASKPTASEPPEAKRATRAKSAVPASLPSKDLGTLAKKESETANLPAADKGQPVGEMASVAVLVPGVAGGNAVHGAQQKASATGGPYASTQQQAVEQQEIARDQLHSARFDANANGATGGAARAGLAGKNEAQSQMAAVPTPSAPAREVTLQTAAKSSLSVAADEVAVDGKRKRTVLPNGANALSTATAGGRTVAIDPSGAVFLSEAPGAKWMAVATQWSGRAVLVRVEGAATVAGTPTRFELINDQNKVWWSADGKVWLAEASSPQ